MEIFRFDDRLVALAEKKSEEMGTLNNSITGGEGNVAAFIGEYAVKKVYGGKIVNTYDYDILLDDGTRIEVKTKRTTVPPKPFYECSIAEYNTRQKCDFYAFTRVDMEQKIVYVLGCYKKESYLSEARYLKKGMVDGTNNFKVKADCWNMEIRNLQMVPKSQNNTV